MPSTRINGAEALGVELERQPSHALRRLATVAADGAAFRVALRATASDDAEREELVVALLQRTAVALGPGVYRVIPTIRPYAVRDRAARARGEHDEWGTPDARGLLRDDNTLIKRVPCPLPMEGGGFAGFRIGPGWTACHAWRALPAGDAASADPWLYTFAPLVAWVPSAIAPYTDREGSAPQAYLKDVSESYRHVEARAPLTEWVHAAWRKIPPRPAAASPRQTFALTDAFVPRRVRSISAVAQALADAADGRAIPARVVCRRYAAGLPAVDALAKKQLAADLSRYAAAVARAVAS